MTKPVVTQEDVEQLRRISDIFIKNVINNAGGPEAARAEFRKNMRIRDYFNTAVARVRQKVAGSPEGQVRALLSVNMAALPALKASFGEMMLIRSLPVAAQDQRVVDLCRAFGGGAIADMCERATELPKPNCGPKPGSK